MVSAKWLIDFAQCSSCGMFVPDQREYIRDGLCNACYRPVIVPKPEPVVEPEPIVHDVYPDDYTRRKWYDRRSTRSKHLGRAEWTKRYMHNSAPDVLECCESIDIYDFTDYQRERANQAEYQFIKDAHQEYRLYAA